MGQTWGNSEGSSNLPDTMAGFAVQLAAIAAKLEAIDSLKEDMSAMKQQQHMKEKSGFAGGRFDEEHSSFSLGIRRPFHKFKFPTFSGGDPRGWILKAEKYFRFYNTMEKDKVDVAVLHLEGDALDLYSWWSAEHEVLYWETLTSLFQKHFGPPEFQNPDEHLCNVEQIGTVHDYRQEFARRSSRVSNWPEHCLLGVFLNGLRDELKSYVRIHKPRSVYQAASLALEFESKISHTGSIQTNNSTSLAITDSKLNPSSNLIPPAFNQKPIKNHHTDAEKHSQYLKGECFHCGDKYGPGHRCKTSTLKRFEAPAAEEDLDAAVTFNKHTAEVAEISLHAHFGKPNPTIMKLQGVLGNTEIIILVNSGSTPTISSRTLLFVDCKLPPNL